MLRGKLPKPDERPSMAVRVATEEIADACIECIENAGLDANEKSRKTSDIESAQNKLAAASKKGSATNLDAAITVRDHLISLSHTLGSTIDASERISSHPMNGHAGADIVAQATLRIVKVYYKSIMPKLFGGPKFNRAATLFRELEQTQMPRAKIEKLRDACDVMRVLCSVGGAPAESGGKVSREGNIRLQQESEQMRKKSIATVGKTIPWNEINGKPYRIVKFKPRAYFWGGKVRGTSLFRAHAEVTVDAALFGPQEQLVIPINHKVDFANLWEVFRNRGLSEREECLIVRKVIKPRGLGATPESGWPQFLLMVCAIGGLERIYDGINLGTMSNPIREEAIEAWHGFNLFKHGRWSSID